MIPMQYDSIDVHYPHLFYKNRYRLHYCGWSIVASIHVILGYLYIHLRRLLFGDVLVRTLAMKKPIFYFSASHAMKGLPGITSPPMGSLDVGKDHVVPTAA
jgi:hypothetical protein